MTRQLLQIPLVPLVTVAAIRGAPLKGAQGNLARKIMGVVAVPLKLVRAVVMQVLRAVQAAVQPGALLVQTVGPPVQGIRALVVMLARRVIRVVRVLRGLQGMPGMLAMPGLPVLEAVQGIRPTG